MIFLSAFICSSLFVFQQSHMESHAFAITAPKVKFRKDIGSSQNPFSAVHQSTVYPPSKSKHEDPKKQTAIIFLPGCQLQPHQYQDVAKEIQEQSKQNVWVAVPKMPLDFPNPMIVPGAVKAAMKDLQRLGYKGDKAYLGGHSLGGVCILNTIGETGDGLGNDKILGLINLGCFQARSTPDHSIIRSLPSLTMTGDLDGMVRTSRIAEDYHRNVLSSTMFASNEEEAKLHHSVILVEGMNHFGFVQGNAPFMKKLRDLPAEINHEESVRQVGSTISCFIDSHQNTDASTKTKARRKLLSNIDKTVHYLQPLIDALELEGSRHVGCDPEKGSRWATMMQQKLVPDALRTTSSNEFHPSWYLNPFAKVPFFHPKVTQIGPNSVKLETMADPIYEVTDTLFDAGFFSNTCHELQCKFNSPESISDAIEPQSEDGYGDTKKFETAIYSTKHMNQRAIDWALEHSPERVKRRYRNNGIRLETGDDIAHHSGPGWIWSYMDYEREETSPSVCRVKSHIMTTSIDHPIPTAGGKHYCKLLSPAKALDWMYTDSLRPSPITVLTSLLQSIFSYSSISTAEGA